VLQKRREILVAPIHANANLQLLLGEGSGYSVQTVELTLSQVV
jgi:hypothetical protein